MACLVFGEGVEGLLGVFVGWWWGSDGEAERVLGGVWGFWEGDYVSSPSGNRAWKWGSGKFQGGLNGSSWGYGWKFGMGGGESEGGGWGERFDLRRFSGDLRDFCGFGVGLVVWRWESGLKTRKIEVSITFDFCLFGYLEVFWGVFGGVLGWEKKLKFGEWEKFTSGMKIRMTTHPDFFL